MIKYRKLVNHLHPFEVNWLLGATFGFFESLDFVWVKHCTSLWFVLWFCSLQVRMHIKIEDNGLAWNRQN